VRVAKSLFNIAKNGPRFGTRSNIAVRNAKKKRKFMTKTELRTIALAKRNSLTQSQIQTWSSQICRKLVESSSFGEAKIVHIYNSIGSEVDTNKIIQVALIAGITVIVPEIGEDQNLKHWQVFQNTVYSQDKFGIQTPIANCHLFEISNFQSTDLIIIPIVAFDSHNNRIGYGKGFYDRFLKQIECKKIGIAFNCQLVEDFEPDVWDIPLDQIIQN
jgi:5-formyltetrahydrofolate cyclo-ligase